MKVKIPLDEARLKHGRPRVTIQADKTQSDEAERHSLGIRQRTALQNSQTKEISCLGFECQIRTYRESLFIGTTM